MCNLAAGQFSVPNSYVIYTAGSNKGVLNRLDDDPRNQIIMMFYNYMAVAQDGAAFRVRVDQHKARIA